MSKVTPPKYVKQVLVTLQSRGYLAYLVGGCVRDMILGVHPQDWDICTSALPDQVRELFPRTLTVGIRHGTVTVLINSHAVEVTTFRSDGSYADHRHPEAVSFVGDLTSDLARRDFTMNAIALPPDGLIADPFGGIADIEKGLIRCVGEPKRRFEEDALRMFRALRFSARLGFTVEEQTLAAIYEKAPLAASLSAERVRDEVEKMLLTKQPQILLTVIDAGLLDRYLRRRGDDPVAELIRITALPKKALPRWAAFCAILERHGLIDSPQSFLQALRLDGRTLRCCGDCCALLRDPPPKTPKEWKILLNRYGVDTTSCAAQCSDILYTRHCRDELRAVLKSGECFSIRHLAVTGDDLVELGLRGRELGEMLNFLLDYVMDYPENNRRELLLQLAGGTEES
jgi:tRNA nucleotidyltransferase (CCA-adding enzyme)